MDDLCPVNLAQMADSVMDDLCPVNLAQMACSTNYEPDRLISFKFTTLIVASEAATSV